MFDDLIKNLLVECLFQPADWQADVLLLVRDWANAPRNFKNKDLIRAFVNTLDKGRQSAILFYLSAAGADDVEVGRIAAMSNLNFFLLDAQTRFELAPPRFKRAARAYLEAVKNGESCDVPRFWGLDEFGHVETVFDDSQ